MRAVLNIGLTICLIWLCSQCAYADTRIALVIGNSAYQSVAPLSNPANDAGAMATMFRNAGFDVVELKRDLKANEMRRALRELSDRVRDADVAVVYYAGHGIEIDNTNYLIPVDAVLERDIDAFDEAIPLDRLLAVVEPAKKLRLIILDACRDNPFGKTMKHTVATRSIGRGLAKVEPNSPNTLIAFAAKAGSTASDGDSNSPFTVALVKHLPKPGLDLRKAFGFTRDDVLKATNYRQEPFIYGSLGGDDVSLVPPVTPPRASAPADPYAAARRDYELALQINTEAIWNSFISNYSSGFYADLAIAQLGKLKAAAIAKADEDERVAGAKKASDEARAKAEAQPARDNAATAAKQKPAIGPTTYADASATDRARIDGETKPAPPPLQLSCSDTSTRLEPLASRSAKPMSRAEECGLKAKDVFKECQDCPEMVTIPGGVTFMGSDKKDIDSGIAAANEGPRHRISIKQPVAVGRFEITKEQYEAFVKSSGYSFGNRCYTFENNIPEERANRSFLNPGYVQSGTHPVVCVSWTDATAYVRWLSQTTGKEYRLLSEAEYEYAARGGSTSRYGFGDEAADICKFANGADQSAKVAGLPNNAYMNCNDGYPFTAPVGSFAANAFGLYDLIGNVWEWTEDCFYSDYASASAANPPRSEPACSTRTVRGGDWYSSEASLRPAVRAKADVGARHDDIGFRVARTLWP